MELWHESAGDGQPILLLHAGVCDARMWEHQMTSLAGWHQVIRADLRGFGRSPFPAEKFSFARDVVELIERLDAGPVVLLGASMSGRVALEVATARPDLIEGLILANAVLPGWPWSQPVRAFGAEEEAALDRGNVEAAVEANLKMWVDGPKRDRDGVDPVLRGFVATMQRDAFHIQLPMWDEADEELMAPDVGDSLGELGMPTLVIDGALDVEDIHEIARRIAGTVPDAKLEVIGGVAHLPSLERAAEFDRLVLSFVG
jgi:pimeloyl-ACP methyl ester carboxylesterase